MQNWPAPIVSEAAQPLPISGPRAATASGRTNIGLTDPSSPKKGIGSGPRGAEVEERPAAAERAGEADGLDQWMLDQRRPDVALAALDQTEDAGVDARALDRGMDRLRDDLAGARMRRVALDDHRAAAASAAAVAAGRREGEREIGGAEYRDRADRPLDHHEIGPRHRLAVGQRDVVAAVEVVALADVLGEEAELPDGTPALAFEPGRGQAGLGAADRGDGLGARFDLVGDAVRKAARSSREA